MTPIKAVLNEIHENNKRHPDVIDSFSVVNLNLNLCKTFLLKIKDVDFSMIGAGGKLKQDIAEFLQTINKKQTT